MGAGKGKGRRAQSAAVAVKGNWKATLPKSFPVDEISPDMLAKPSTTRQLVSLSSAISSRVISTRLHEAREQAQPAFGFVDGQTVVTGENGNTCDCERSRSQREQGDGSVREFICAHQMATIGARLLEKAERYDRNQQGLRLLAKLSSEEDEEQREELHAELLEAFESTAEAKPAALRKILSAVRNSGVYGRNKSVHLSDLLAAARGENGSLRESFEDYEELIQEQEKRKGENIPLDPELKIRREIKAAMYNNKPTYKGFSPVITPAVLRPQQISFYRKPSGDGLLIVRFEDNGELVYADLEHESKTLTVGGFEDANPDSVTYAAYLYPMLDDANTQLHDGSKLSEDLQALNHFPAEFYDSKNSQTMQGKSDTRLRAMGSITGAVYRGAVRAQLTGQITRVRRVDGSHSDLVDRWNSDFKAPEPVIPGLVAERVAF